MINKSRHQFNLAVLAGLVILGIGGFAHADVTEQQVLVDKATLTFKKFVQNPEYSWIQNNLQSAKGILIVPRMVKAGFVLGGSGGRAVLLMRDEKSGQWSEPGFYTIGSVTFGFQIGGEAAEVVMVVKSQNGAEKLLASSFKLGGDSSIAVGPVGAGVKSDIVADIVSFSESTGAYAGLNLEGSVIKISEEWNDAYYGKKGVRATDIFVAQSVKNPNSKGLREAVASAGK